MKIVDWAGLKALPEGSIIQAMHPVNGLAEPMVFGGVCGDRDNVPNDFLEAQLLPELRDGSTFGGYLPEGATEHDEIVTLPSGYGRYALYDLWKGHHRWLVWEERDRALLAHWLLDPAACSAEQNDDNRSFVIVPQPQGD